MSLATDIATIDADTIILHNVIHGSSVQTVATEGGTIPTVAKRLFDLGTGSIRGAWVTATAYALNDVVSNGGLWYRCIVAHTSAAAFATDLAATRWIVAVNPVMGLYAVDTIAQLKALTITFDSVLVRGYYAAGDGGGGTFRWNSADVTADNGGNVIIPNAGGTGRWNLIATEYINLRQFGAKMDGTTDDSAAFQASIEAGKLLQITVVVPWGITKIVSPLTIYNGTRIIGQSQAQATSSYSMVPKASKILFSPAATADLFTASWSGAVEPFITHVDISGISMLAGNANARRALSIEKVIYSGFSNLGIEGFQIGIYCKSTIQNEFNKVRVTGCTTYDVHYDGGVCTTDVWVCCSFFLAPTGIYIDGAVNIKFFGCIFEQLNVYGVDMTRECQSIEFVNCYSEDVPFTNNAAGAVFRYGATGAALVVQNGMIVIGGQYKGRNAGAVGSFISTDYCNGVMVSSVNFSKFTNGFVTTANTRATSIVVNGMAYTSVTTFATDTTKIIGVYPRGVINSGSNTHDAVFGLLSVAARTECPDFRYPGFGAPQLGFDALGNSVMGNAAVATTATDGFLHLVTCAGAPTGVPSLFTGRKPIVFDTTNNKIWVYNGTWKGVVVA